MNTSVIYASARAKMRYGSLLSAAQYERLLSAPSVEEAYRVLGEFGFIGQTLDEMLLGMQKQFFDFFREVSPDKAVTAAFLLETDFRNLKILFKAKLTGASPALAISGTVDEAKLAQAVHGGDYHALPDAMKRACAEAEGLVAVTQTPSEIDLLFDRAYYAAVAAQAAATGNRSIKAYFAARADLKNISIMMRLKALGFSADRLEGVLVPGGSIPLGQFAPAYQQPERLAALAADPAERAVVAAGLRAFAAGQGAAAFERMADDYLLSIFKSAKAGPLSLETFVGYFVAKQRDIASVRLIMTGLENGFGAEVIRERLGESFV